MTSQDHHGHRRPHAILITTLLAGHWNPMKTLLFRLVEHGISCTVINSPLRLSELRQLKLQGVFGNVDVELIEGFSNSTKVVNPIMDMLEELRDQFYERPEAMQKLIARKSSSSGATFIIVDSLLFWVKDIAETLQVRKYLFFTYSCGLGQVFIQAKKIGAEGFYPTNPGRRKLDETVDLPGLQLYRVRDMPAELRDDNAFIGLSGQIDGIIVDSFEQFEGVMASTFRTVLSSVITDAKAFFVGPVAGYPTIASQQAENSECLQFLDSQRTASVIYICFGSVYQPTPSALHELARALELTNVPFLWILPPSPANAPKLEGFSSHTEGRGLVWSGWVPQTAILDHPSVGGFVSHCGWNSLQEAILAGVPIIPWPIHGEQAMNARFLVRELKVAVPIFENVDDTIGGEDIAKAIQLLMDSESGEAVKKRMQELQNKARAAVVKGGPSYTEFLKFVEEVSKDAPS